ncbi:MAG: hypothetical protein KGD65_01945 [Candidatus Lokiarchaeota archaeon]|nr:hypothetical protein [Candidatus Lokiarchaeota archaeon]
MSKIPKVQTKDQKSNTRRRSDDKFAYRTVVISTALSLIFAIVSFLFNTGIISIFIGINLVFDIIDIVIKVFSILLFFLFMMISIGNYKEMTGKPVDWKEFLLLFILSLGQTLLSYIVFISTFLGLLLILIYLYFVQEK